MKPLLVLAFALACASDGVVDDLAGTGQPGFSGDGGPAVQAVVNQPFDLVYNAAGDLFFADTGNHRVRRVDATTGVVTTIAGNGEKGFSGDGGPATAARMDEPYGLAIDPDGNLYFADRLNRRIRRVDAKTAAIATIAGDGSNASSGDSGPGVKAGIVEPNDVALDGRGQLAIADVSGHRVRVLDLSTGIISTLAGDGRGRHSGDGGPAKSASLSGPRAIRFTPDGALLILERNGNTLRSVSTDGMITTIAGNGKKGYQGDGGPAKDASFDGPKELDLDAQGNILIVDTENNAIRRVDSRTGVVSTVAKGLDRPHGVAFAPDGTSFVIGDTLNHRLRRVRPKP
ncbi:SMP-30/gluconolactonase/LRE family protein [Paludisphaera borealis]|uniref:Virginiamycin B lyase n=1 Tax=Paludisphaera borealis TaxID=1387353 RepID=A0A1U7CPX5_9BACT|nr:SMP-30/gluconolactonase/LRE family protein [Paludisphaera borealis]APW60971.1 Virginiamycin B lyase [Paludisphaera borealis]